MKTDADKFSDYAERGLSFENSLGTGGRNALCDKEKIAWELYESAGPAGSVLLGDALIRARISYLRKDINAVQFARKLLSEGFVSLENKLGKNSWDWYYLGICHESGRGTPVDHGKAAERFRKAKELGNPYAEYEAIWSSHLAGAQALDTIFRFRDYSYSGRLNKFADRSAHALTVLEMGPTREIGSTQHICRICELSGLLHQFYYHDAGSRHINVRVGKEMKLDVDRLKLISTPSAALALFLISQKSPTNPTGETSEFWLQKAIDPQNSPFVTIVKRERWNQDRLLLVANICKTSGWEDTEIGRFARHLLDQAEEDRNEDSY